MKKVEVNQSGRIEWMYPNIYPHKPLDKLIITLYHVRAANEIEIEFDSARNGYVIYMSSTVGWRESKEFPDCVEDVEERREKAFIPAWNDDDIDVSELLPEHKKES